MYELIYTSSAKKPFNSYEIDEILAVSRPNNFRDGITGLLLYHDSKIIQLLEGPKAKVLSAYSKIAEDQRHENVTAVYQGAIAKRAFSSWAMAFCEPHSFSDLPQLGTVQRLSNDQPPNNMNNNVENVGMGLALFYKRELNAIQVGP